MTTEQAAILVLYAAVVPLWMTLSAWTIRRARNWAFTPSWHRRVVPAFRVFFIGTLPLEVFLAERPFILPVFAVGAAATLGWLAVRARYLLTAPRELPAADSVRYNLAYVANLATFALACHSFACLVVMLNVSIPLLLVREAHARGGPRGTSVHARSSC